MKTINIDVNLKQKECLGYLFDDQTTTIVFGGSWRSGKSYVIAFFSLLSIMKHKNIRILVARNFYTDLRQTTVKTFEEVISKYELTNRVQINKNPYNIKCAQTGSEIIFMGVDGSDSNAFRGLSLTHVCVDEASEFPEHIIKQLYGRLSYGITENNIKSKVFLCTNATKGWLYRTIYTPAKQKELPIHTKFINATLFDNEQFLPPGYLDNMTREIIGDDRYELFVMSNWDYVVGANNILEQDDVFAAFYSVKADRGDKYITVDPAGGNGGDNSVIVVWNGYVIEEIILFNNQNTNYLVDEIQKLMMKHSLNPSNVIIEVNGLGLAIQQQIRNSTPYIPNSTNIEGFNKQEFTTLKDYCYYTTAKLFKERKIQILSGQYIDKIGEEFTAHKYIDTGGKVKISPKEEVKKRIGHSPDISDAIVMRMIKTLKTKPNFSIEVWEI